MGSITLRRGKLFAQARRRGQSESKTFAADQRREAAAWIADTEARMLTGRFISLTEARRHTLHDFLLLYAEHVSPNRGQTDKNAGKKELTHLRILDESFLSGLRIADLKPGDIKRWVQERRQYVSPRTKQRLAEGTIRRTFDVLCSVLEFAADQLGIEGHRNPCRDVKGKHRPRPSEASNRRLAPGEFELFLKQLQMHEDGLYVGVFLFLLLSGWRRGEAVLLRPEWIDRRSSTVRMPVSKTGKQERALSPQTLQLLSSLPIAEDGRYFPFDPDTLTHMAPMLCRRASIMHFVSTVAGDRYVDAAQIAVLAPRLRLSELVELRRDRLVIEERVAKFPNPRSSTLRRRILPGAAIAILAQRQPIRGQYFFDVTETEIEGVLKAANAHAIAHGFTPHVLRAEFATRLLKNGTAMKIIAAYTGHKTIEALERYLRPTPQEAALEFGTAVDAAMFPLLGGISIANALPMIVDASP